MGPWPGVAKDDVHTAPGAPGRDRRGRRRWPTSCSATICFGRAAALGRVLAATVELDAIHAPRRAAAGPRPIRAVDSRTSPACGRRPGWRCQGLAGLRRHHGAGSRPRPQPRLLGDAHRHAGDRQQLRRDRAAGPASHASGTCLGAGAGHRRGGAARRARHGRWPALCILGQMLGALTAQRRYDGQRCRHRLFGRCRAAPAGRLWRRATCWPGSTRPPSAPAVALLASRLVLPVYGGDQARQQIRAILARCRAACAAWWPPQPAAATPESRQSAGPRARSCWRSALPQLNTEAVLGQRSAAEVVRLSTFLRVLQTYLVLVEQAAARLGGGGRSGHGRSGAGRISRRAAGGVRRARVGRGAAPCQRGAHDDPARGRRHGGAATAGPGRVRRFWRWSSTRSTAKRWHAPCTASAMRLPDGRRPIKPMQKTRDFALIRCRTTAYTEDPLSPVPLLPSGRHRLRTDSSTSWSTRRRLAVFA